MIPAFLFAAGARRISETVSWALNLAVCSARRLAELFSSSRRTYRGTF